METLKFTQLKKGNHLPSASTFGGSKCSSPMGGFSPHLPSWISPKSRLHWRYHWKPYGYLPKGSNKHSRLSWRWRLSFVEPWKPLEELLQLWRGNNLKTCESCLVIFAFFASRRHENCPFSKTEAGLRKKQGFRRAQMKTCDILWLWMLPSCWVVSPRNPKKKCCKSFPCPAFRMAEASNCLMIFVQGPAWGKFAAQVLIELRMLLVLANETTSLPNPIKHHKSTTTHRSLKQHKKSASVSQFVSDDPVKSSMMWTSLAIVQQKQRYAKCYKNGQGFHGFLGISLKWTKNSNHSMQPRGKYVGGFQLRWWHQIQHRHLVTEGLHHSDSTEKNCNFFC